MSPLDLTKDPDFVPSENTEATEHVVLTDEADSSSHPTQEDLTVKPQPAENSESTVRQASSNEIVDFNQYSKTELVSALKEALNKDISSIKYEVDAIKQVYYKKIKAQTEELKANFLQEGGEEIDFLAPKDETEEVFKALLNQYRAEKAVFMAQIEKEKEQNLLLKQHILLQMKALTETNDDMPSHISEFRELRQKWRAIGQVPSSATSELWKQFNLYQETFWDLIKINNELRDYDFRKNLEVKTALCESAEKLAQNGDPVLSNQLLAKLQEEWYESGPVARELREEIWDRFREAITAVNRNHQSHFESLRAMEDANLALKEEVCKKVEAIDIKTLKSFKDWDNATKEILALQEEWKTIGFAPRKINQQLFERYRASCSVFFNAKNQFYQSIKEVMSKNAELKRGLCEQAEALKESQEWKETTDKLINIQKEWKKIGPSSKKHTDELWKRFTAACDYFFGEKSKNTVDYRKVEYDNLEKKKGIIEQIIALDKLENSNETLNKFRALMNEWNGIGFVPINEKSRIYSEYRKHVDKQFERFNIDLSNRRMENFRENLKDMVNQGEQKLYKEREKLMHSYEHLKSEIATYENNIGFFSNASKKGSKLIQEMERKLDALKEECKLLEQKIGLIDEKL